MLFILSRSKFEEPARPRAAPCGMPTVLHSSKIGYTDPVEFSIIYLGRD